MNSAISPQAERHEQRGPSLVRGLGMMDSAMLIVGGIIGSGIFLTAGQIADEVRYPAAFLMVWVAGGAITLLACFAFAELGAMFPEAGGQYVYLREAYGEFPAFLYGWILFAVGQCGAIATLAVGFAEYFGAIWPAGEAHILVGRIAGFTLTRGHLVSIAAIAFLTVVNALGVRRGAALIDVATWAKCAAIAVFVMLGVAIGRGDWSHYSAATSVPMRGSALSAFGVALIAVFWAYDGWVYISWVAGEVKNPQRTLPRAMVISVVAVLVIYFSINAVYLYALPMDALARETSVARAAAIVLFSPGSARWLGALIALSCFGSLCAATMSGARVYYAMAQDGLFFHRMARVHERWRTPAFSLAVQGVWASVLALSGRYDQLFTYSMFAMVASYAATVAAVFVLRRKRPDHPRPYRCTGYPWLPALYLIIVGAWILNGAWQRPTEALASGVLAVLGLPGYLYWRRRH
ncbi:MAG: APC family permease [Terriglobales bacterium]